LKGGDRHHGNAEEAAGIEDPRASEAEAAKAVRRGLLMLDGYGGRTEQEVEIVGETPKRTRIRAITPTRLAGRRRMMRPGEVALVPKYAVKEKQQP
jgi:hypothetical protein